MLWFSQCDCELNCKVGHWDEKFLCKSNIYHLGMVGQWIEPMWYFWFSGKFRVDRERLGVAIG